MVVMLGWLALVSDLTWLDRLWFDTTLRIAAPFRRPVHNRILNLDVEAEDLKNWNGPSGEYNGVANLIAGLRKQGARVIVLDLMFPSGTPKEFQQLWQQLAHKSNDVVLGRTGEEETLLPARLKKRPPEGLLLLDPDPDGVLRSYRYARDINGARPSLALAAYLKHLRREWRPEWLLPNGWVEFPDISPDGDAITRYLPAQTLLDLRADWTDKNPRNFGHFTPRDLRQWNKKGGKRLAGAIVLVGYVAAGAMDRGPTALNPSTPKVSLHAAALNDLIQDSWRAVAPRPLHLAFATFFTLAAWWLGALNAGGSPAQ